MIGHDDQALVFAEISRGNELDAPQGTVRVILKRPDQRAFELMGKAAEMTRL
jgi:hypothetical protein